MSASTIAPVEHVLVVPTEVFHRIGRFQGFCTDVEPYLKGLLDPEVLSYRPRNEMEENPGFKQLIPYCLFCHDGRVFHYRRTSGQGESRLHGKRSVGVGGHINDSDANRSRPAYEEGMRREIEEEIELTSEATSRLIGLINDDETEVGKVHLGLVHRFDLITPKVRPRETTMIETGFSDPHDLLGQSDEFESWSQIALQALVSS